MLCACVPIYMENNGKQIHLANIGSFRLFNVRPSNHSFIDQSVNCCRRCRRQVDLTTSESVGCESGGLPYKNLNIFLSSDSHSFS